MKTIDPREQAKLLAESLKNNQELLDTEIPISVFRSVQDPYLFNLSLVLRRKEVRIWPGIAKVQILDISQKHRQILLRVRENTATFSREVRFQSCLEDPSFSDIQNFFPISTPVGTAFSHEILTRPKRLNMYNFQQHYKVTATTPTSTRYFLVGYDEDHLFISQVKRSPKTVREAHASLIPKAVKEKRGVVRQGELFFVKATKKEVEETLRKGFSPYNHRVPILKTRDHRASFLLRKHYRKEYVIGKVENPRHKTLVFTEWHRVFRNDEVVTVNATNWD